MDHAVISAVKYASLLLLLLLIYSAVYHVLTSLTRRRTASVGLKQRAGRRGIIGRLLLRGRIAEACFEHLSDLLSSSRVRLGRTQFILLSAIFSTAGVTTGLFYFASMKGVVVLGGLLLVTPYIWLRTMLITMQIKHRIDILPAVESFYQQYVLSETKNVRTVLRAVLEGERLPPSVKPVFEQLHLGLVMHRGNESCLRTFAMMLGGRWSAHLAAMLQFALEDGTDLCAGLEELITDMRRAIRTDHADRNRLLEIRIANFSPLLFLIVFMVVNFRIDFDQSYRYYVVSETGRSMLLDALLLIGASFGMGLYLSMRKV